MQDFSLYDRCITRGAVGSFMPAVYGNGARIIQTPDSVVITYEMVHDTRVIPLDGRPHARRRPSSSTWATRAATARATRWSSSRATSPTAPPSAAPGTATQLRLTERFTRIDPEMIDYEIRVEDPDDVGRSRGRCG